MVRRVCQIPPSSYMSMGGKRRNMETRRMATLPTLRITRMCAVARRRDGGGIGRGSEQRSSRLNRVRDRECA
ncbi:hypothetical protein BRADI_2g47846v3 [Brachypodium distachyon]|uniref:Uncharacterized protein n=1 Tax=Brachypodium distachyon TaxID=15368 RepID=A0A2K2DEI6_BRADI|nr:hypothetical protein BRADI_2g47846v3 [Brachypodium distachyon]